MGRKTYILLSLVAVTLLVVAMVGFVPRLSINANRFISSGDTAGASLFNKEVLVSTPAFSMQDATGERHTFVVNLRFARFGDAATICRWMPIFLDRINEAVNGAQLERGEKKGGVSLSLEKHRIKAALSAVHSRLEPDRIDFIDVTYGDESARGPNAPLVCFGDRLDLRRSPVFLG